MSHKIEIVLGTTAMEITPLPTALNSTELIVKDNISAVYPVKFNKKPNNAQINYSGSTGSFSIGQTVTGATSGATGIITQFVGTTGIILSDVVGTFQSGENFIWGLGVSGVGTSAGPGTWNGVTGATSGSGTGMTFDVTDTTGIYDTIAIATNGIGYQIGDTVTILGTSLGGATPANDLVITITGDTAVVVGNQIPMSFDGEWIYEYPTMTCIQVQMQDGSRMAIELQNVTNQPTWNTGDLAGLNAAIAAINAWL